MALNKIDKLNSQVSTSAGKIPVIRPTENLSEEVQVIGNQLVLNNTIKPPVPKVTFYSSKLLNYVEPFPISGTIKTAFYSELSTNIQVGDRVFIFNGFYDSDDYLQKDKYTKYTDGYRVLAIDGCKIVLDIDYTGQLPYTDFSLDDLIFVHNVTSQERYIYVNSMYNALNIGFFNTQLTNYLYSSFFGLSQKSVVSLYGANIMFIGAGLKFLTFNNGIFGGGFVDGGISGNFFTKFSPTSNPFSWFSITNNFKANRLRVIDKNTNPLNKIGNKKIFIIGEDFTFEGFVFKERCVYKYQNKKWVLDKSYKQPIISKNNFRAGDFKGTHNDGIFGSYDVENIWEDAVWNSGVFVNSRWKSGQMRSKSKKGDLNYVARLDFDTEGKRVALQNTDTSDNKGIGYNYIVDSVILQSTIRNGFFENNNIGLKSWSTSAIDNYYNKSATFSVVIGAGNFTFCDIWSTSINFAKVNDSIVNNSLIKQSNSVSNQLIDTVADIVNYSSEGGIQILGADLYSYYLYANRNTNKSFSDIRGVLKIFISDKDFLRMEKGDSFYFEKVNKDFFLSSLDSNDRILLPIEARYLLDFFSDVENTDVGFRISATLKNRVENRNKYYVELEQTPILVSNYVPDTNSDVGVWEILTQPPSSIPIFDTGPNQLLYPVDQYVRFNDNGVNRIYQYTGDPATNVPTGPLATPLDVDTNGNNFWIEVGIFLGEWPLLAPLEFLNEIIENDIYLYNGYYLRKTSTFPVDKGAGYLDIPYQNGFDNKRKMTVKPSDFDACSIDIDSTYFGFYVDSFGIKRSSNLMPTESIDQIGERGLKSLPLNRINDCFVNSYIKPSDFRSGLMIDSNWYNGYNINYYNNIIRKKNNSSLDINFDSKNVLSVNINNNPYDITYNKPGFDISLNDNVWLNGVYYGRQYSTNTKIDLSGRYQVKQIIKNPTFITYIIESKEKTFDSLLDPDGYYFAMGAEDANYITLSKLHIEKTNILSGLFRRTSLKNLTIYNAQFNNQDTSFSPSNMNLLRLVNIVYSNNNLIINSGVHLNCHFYNPTFNNSIVQESIWNGALFKLGIFSSGFWKSGTFNNGKFLSSRGISLEKPYFSSTDNLRLWLDGSFSLGEFYDSAWYGGIFNNGLFWNSDFYAGIWNNGVLGSLQIPMNKTTFGHYQKTIETAIYGGTAAFWYNGTVDNALMGGDGIVYWYNGRYNSGEFTSYGSDASKESIWYDGEFNGSEITHLARWKNGNFKRGKFLSYYGWDKVGPTSSSSKNPTDYGWEKGIFQDGEFGFAGLTANSVWYSGQFNNGIFRGRFWNSGFFINGSFLGSGKDSLTASNISNKGEFDFAYSFSKEYYGLWNDGVVLENESQSEFEGASFFNRARSVEDQIIFQQETVFENMLWLKGTFSHRNSVFRNSLFLSGNFQYAKFDGGVFNPYIDRTFEGTMSNVSFGNSALWSSGNFLSGHFWASTWLRGNFYDGFISGADWKTGTFFYGTAENILWRDGTWKNGNWNGSPYDYTLISPTESSVYDPVSDTIGTVSQFVMNSGREKEVMTKVSLYNTVIGDFNPLVHVLNVFSSSTPLVFTSDSFTSSRSWTSSSEIYFGLGEEIVGYGPKGIPLKRIFPNKPLQKSSWLVFGSFELVKSTEPAGYLNSDNTVSQTIKPKFNSSTLKSTVTVRDANLATFGGELGYIPGTNLRGYNGGTLPTKDAPPSRKLYMMKNFGAGFTRDVFQEPSTTYTIKLTLSVEMREFVDVKVYVGLVGESTFRLRSDAYKYTIFRGSASDQYEDYYPKVYTITSVYSTTSETISTEAGRQFWIEKPSFGIVRLLKCEIVYQPIEYNLEFNNKLISSISSGNLDNSSTVIDFPTYSVTLSAASGNGKEVGLIFGNGVFKNGIWENGVWNNGYRSNSDFDGWGSGNARIEDDLVKAYEVVATETYKISSTSWRVTLNILSDNLSILKPNKKVSIGNIVGIDINGNRRFFRDPISIISINGLLKKIVVRIVSNFELREIRRDSKDHLIYITQNIWLNGVFLNGYFRGVWNNGVFKGFPRLTEMKETHFIDGVFDGGHFISEQYYDDENRVFYNTSLIQNMLFNDKNVAEPGAFVYQSWIDTPYSTQSIVNLNADTNDYFVLFPLTTISSPRYRANLVGYPILDVLSSVSNFRDAESDFVQTYMLGTKRTQSVNMIPSQGQFKNSVSNRIPQVGLNSFLLDGWTYSFFNGTLGYGTPNRKLIVESNTTISDRKTLNFSMTASDIDDISTILLLNNKNITTQPNRYYEIDITLEEKILGTNSFMSFTPYDYQDFTASYFNHAQTDTLNKKEYFYNKFGLDLIYFSDGIYENALSSLKFKNISFYEVDMVPFLRYASASNVDQTIRPSYVGVAPKIDYADNNFDFIDNVDLGIDFRVINLQNNIVKASTLVKGTSIPIEYVIQAGAESAETDISSGGNSGGGSQGAGGGDSGA